MPEQDLVETIFAFESIVEWPIIHAKLPEGVRDQYPLANEDEA